MRFIEETFICFFRTKLQGQKALLRLELGLQGPTEKYGSWQKKIKHPPLLLAFRSTSQCSQQRLAIKRHGTRGQSAAIPEECMLRLGSLGGGEGYVGKAWQGLNKVKACDAKSLRSHLSSQEVETGNGNENETRSQPFLEQAVEFGFTS